jgi:hypothetical protein
VIALPQHPDEHRPEVRSSSQSISSSANVQSRDLHGPLLSHAIKSTCVLTDTA